LPSRTAIPPLRASIRNRHLAVADLIGCAAALVLAYSIRFESWQWPPAHSATFWRVLPVVLVIKAVVFYWAGIYRRRWRHAGLADLGRLLAATTIAGGAILFVGVWLLPVLGLIRPRLPVSVAVLDAGLTFAALALPRLAIRWWAMRPWSRRAAAAERRVVIAGAGAAGELVAKELRANPQLGLSPVGFLDDDPSTHGQVMCGLKVLARSRACPSTGLASGSRS